MLDEITGLDLGEIPSLESPQVYIYVLENSIGLIKIGQTRNIKKRVSSLSGSNSQGNAIIRVYCSQGTYLKSLERTIHDYYSLYRIKGTEWFHGLEFEKVTTFISNMFTSYSYKIANDLRRKRNDS